MKSLTGNFSSARGWAVLLILFLGAGLFVAACGEEEVPAPTTPAPTPPPTPEPTPPPAPEPTAVPSGLRVSDSGADFIEWSWSPVEGASGYDVQYSANEAFTDEDEVIARTAEEISYRKTGLAAGTTAYLRVRSAAGMGEERVTSGWSTHITGMTMAAEPVRPPAPANVRESSRGADYIVWTWDPVPGADGYEAQFSLSADFTSPQDFLLLTTNSVRVPNLESEAAGYLRVRSYTGSGTGTDTVRSEWSEPDTATTREPLPAVALDAPGRVSRGERNDDSIVVTWDEVRNAATYEVRQREDGDSAWTGASCGADGDNEVGTNECVATGLAPGTDYEFQVKAVPAGSDSDRYLESLWSDTLDASTTGRRRDTPISGGMGALNITWQSDGESITWIWDRVPGKSFDFVLAVENYNRKANPCATKFDVEDTELTAHESLATSYKSTTEDAITRDDDDADGVALLCVRTSDGENFSYAWGALSPTAATASQTDGVSMHATRPNEVTSLTWTSHTLIAGFNWETRLVVDPQGSPAYDVTEATVRSGTAMQKACEDGGRVEVDETDVRFLLDEVTVRSGLKPYTGYVLCSRYYNGDGTTGGTTTWSVPEAKLYTHPGRPPTPTVDSARSDATSFTWRVATRDKAGLPRLKDGYDAKRVVYDVTYDDGGTRRNTTVPQASDCEAESTSPTRGTWAWDDVAPESITTDNMGISLKSGTIDANVGSDASTTGVDKKVRLCVQAKDGDRMGPWVISGVSTVKGTKGT